MPISQVKFEQSPILQEFKVDFETQIKVFRRKRRIFLAFFSFSWNRWNIVNSHKKITVRLVFHIVKSSVFYLVFRKKFRRFLSDIAILSSMELLREKSSLIITTISGTVWKLRIFLLPFFQKIPWIQRIYKIVSYDVCCFYDFFS